MIATRTLSFERARPFEAAVRRGHGSFLLRDAEALGERRDDDLVGRSPALGGLGSEPLLQLVGMRSTTTPLPGGGLPAAARCERRPVPLGEDADGEVVQVRAAAVDLAREAVA